MSFKNDEKEFCYDLRITDPAEKIPNFNIDDSIREALCFRENLIAYLKEDNKKDDVVSSSGKGKEIGGYCITIESIGPKGNEFMIQIISSLGVNDSYAGTKVTASSNCRFRCLEEKRTEFINRCDGFYEKKLYVGLEDNFYHIESEESSPCDKTINKIDIPHSFNENIICEGVNVLLIRYLALINYHGSLSFHGLTIEGKITVTNYRCYEYRLMKFNNNNIKVYTVERRIHEQCGLIHNSKTHLTIKGKILKHDWIEIPYLLKINPIIDPDKIDTDHCMKNYDDPLESRLNKNVQLMSLYLDKKTCKMAQQNEYLTDHPEIKQLISDFVESLLFVKPNNVLSYAIQHFASFSKNPEKVFSDIEITNIGFILSKIFQKKLKTIVCKFCGICYENFYPEDGECPCLKSRSQSKTSSCSVFKNCHKEALCNLNFRKKTNSLASSSCSVLTKCDSDASCVRKKIGNRSYPSSSSCSVLSKCSSDDKCVKKLSNNCEVSSSDCRENCEGCKTKINKKVSKNVCGIDYDCEYTCEGCLKACRILKDCPECPGCRNNCDYLEDNYCPDCRGCK